MRDMDEQGRGGKGCAAVGRTGCQVGWEKRARPIKHKGGGNWGRATWNGETSGGGQEERRTLPFSKSPTYRPFSRSRASSECPTSSNASVASWPVVGGWVVSAGCRT